MASNVDVFTRRGQGPRVAKARKKQKTEKPPAAKAVGVPPVTVLAAPEAASPALDTASPRREMAPRRPALDSERKRWAVGLTLVVALFGAWMWWRHTQALGDDRAELLHLNIVAEHPHDRAAFTQGLQWIDGTLYESTGLRGQSSLRRINLADWSVQQHVDLPDTVFGEGIAVAGDRIFQISWQDGIAYVWNRRTFARITEHRYQGEGWGLCWDGEHLVMSDGTDRLAFRDPDTFRVVREVHVHRGSRAIDQLNELECVDGVVYANVWQTNDIARIDPKNGEVTGWIDASDLLTEQQASEADVLNGITYLPDSGRFLLTGKLWPRSFEVEFVPNE